MQAAGVQHIGQPRRASGRSALQLAPQLRSRAVPDGFGKSTDAVYPLRRSMPIHRGDLFWLGAGADDTRDPAPTYLHPHVVVQDDVFNHSRISTVVVCALTSNLQRASEPGNVLLDVGEGDLPRQSVVVVSQVACVAKALLGERIGALSDARVDQIVAGLRFQQASFGFR